MAKMTLTKAEALLIQAEQVAWYGRNHSGLAEKVAAATTADSLQDNVEYPIHVINDHIPRGAAIEYMCGIAHNCD